MSWSMPANINWNEIDELRTIPPKGYYKVNIHKVEKKESREGATLIKFHCRITEGAHDGSWIHDVLKLPTSAEDTKLIKYWKPLAIATNHNINETTLTRLNAFVLWEPRTKSDGYDNIKFLEQAIWERERAVYAS